MRPNYAAIHARPLPLDVHILPVLIPHNPLSVLHVAYVYLSLWLGRSSSSHRAHGIFSPETNSVHVTDIASVRLLWEAGFFGKGSLSRSDPTWLDREKKRLGLVAHDTSEEYTRKRREERRQMKLERARLQHEAIELERKRQAGLDPVSPRSDEVQLAATVAEQLEEGTSQFENASNAQVHQQEHLQLTCEEALFLSYGLNVLDIYESPPSPKYSVGEFFQLCRRHSYFPPISRPFLSPDDSFLLSYLVYHHFRSLGWVVRPGIKFAVNWLLYLRGPAFTHAEFAVIIIPSYRQWDEPLARQRERRDWWWLHCLQRVQAQVRKGFVLCYVNIPTTLPDGSDLHAIFRRYSVHDLIIKRWIPNRARD